MSAALVRDQREILHYLSPFMSWPCTNNAKGVLWLWCQKLPSHRIRRMGWMA